jgi:hypothetical protein
LEVNVNAESILAEGEGILHLAPTWVPRTFCIPGKRLKLHPADLYAMGAHRGGIDERWFASTTNADNGPETRPDEGLSYVVYGSTQKPQKRLFKELVGELGASLLGSRLWNQYHEWPVYSKFFDNQGPLPHHLHHRQEHADLVGRRAKPEAYYFPPQVNNHRGDFGYTFFGLEPGTTPQEVRRCLERWDEGDNGILDLSKAYRLQVGTGWDVPAGILHAPGSLCTFEPQWSSDVFAMFQSLVNEVPLGWDMLTKDVPADKKHDLDYIVSLVDWQANVDPEFKRNHFLEPKPVHPIDEMEAEGYRDQWVVYGSPLFSAKELTVLPGRTAVVRDPGPYGLIAVQGVGAIGRWRVESPALIRYGQLTDDEFFVSDQVAREGVRFQNLSQTDPLVVLKYYGPGAWKVH